MFHSVNIETDTIYELLQHTLYGGKQRLAILWSFLSCTLETSRLCRVVINKLYSKDFYRVF